MCGKKYDSFSFKIKINHQTLVNSYIRLLKLFVLVNLLVAALAAPAWAMQAPQISSVQIDAGQIAIQYSSPQALLGLNVYRDGSYVTTIKPAPQRGSVQFSGSAGGYCIVGIVRSDSGESFSPCSAQVSSNNSSTNNTPPIGAGVPTNFRASIYSGSAAELFWGLPSDATSVRSFQLFRDGQLIYSGNGRSYFEDALVSGRVYRYSLRSINNAGGQSNEATYVLVAGEANNQPQSDPEQNTGSLATPANFRGQFYSATAAELFWNAVPGNGIQYQLFRDGALLSTLDGHSYFEGSLQPGRNYLYEVSAIDAAGATSQNVSFTLTAQSDSVNADVAEGFGMSLPSNRFTLQEGNGSGVVVPIQIQRSNENRSPINLSMRSEQGDMSRFLRHSFDHTTIRGESSTSLRIWLDIAAMPLQFHERRYIVTAEQNGRRSEATLFIDVEPVNAPDIYLLVGQSNMEGASERFIRNSNPGGPDELNPRIRQLNVRQNSQEAFGQNWQYADEGSNVTNPRFITAEDPLHEPKAAWVSRKQGQFIGPGLSFAKAALGETSREIYLVPAAWSASGFCDNGFGDRGWNAYSTDAPSHSGTLLADRALTRLNMTLRDTGGILRGILWHQGEADSNNGDCAYRYQENLRRLVERIRGEARGDRRGGAARGSDSDVPFIVGTMSKGQDERGNFSEFGELKTVVDTVHRNVSISIPHAGFVNNDDLRPPTYHCGDNSCVHFGGAAYREMGYRFYQALRGVWTRDGNN